MRKYSWLLILIGHFAMAQSPIDDFFYQEEKIYVVVAVLVIIFCLLIGYLIRLDRKISRLEKEDHEA